MTIAQILDRADKLTIPRLEAELLLAHILQKPREFVIARPELKVSKSTSWQVNKLFKKIKKGIPLAYLTGRKEFYGLDFLVNKHTLIPRPETEMLVELMMDGLKTKDKILRAILIDVGTGSGCVAIAIAKWTRDEGLKTKDKRQIDFFATDISRGALRVARQNAQKHNVKIKFLHGNLLEPIISRLSSLVFRQSHIIITANLPYLTQTEFENEPSIQHEPHSALVAKNNGLVLYEELLEQLVRLTKDKRLTTNSLSPSSLVGRLYFEISPTQTEAIKKMILKYFPTAQIKIHQDLAGLDRIVEIHL